MVINELNKDYIKSFLAQAEHKITIYSPWISEFGTKILIDIFENQKIDIDLYIRFKQSDFALGISDIYGLNNLKRKSFKIKYYQNNSLHAKIYIIDNKEVVFGSCNFTQNAFTDNYEIAFKEKYSSNFNELTKRWSFQEIKQIQINQMINNVKNIKENPEKLIDFVNDNDFKLDKHELYQLGIR